MKKYIFMLSSIALISLPVYAESIESVSHLNELAKNFVQAHIHLSKNDSLEVQMSEQGKQLRLTKCDTNIQVKTPNEANFEQINTLEMSCSGQVRWRVYVPIDMKVLTDVIVAKSTIPAKEIISEDMLTKARFNKNLLYTGYFKHPSQVEGQAAAKTIISGSVLTHKNIQQPIIIKKNQTVSIIARRGPILVKADGIAKSNGALNDSIKVLNRSSKRVIDAIVMSGSTVEVH